MKSRFPKLKQLIIITFYWSLIYHALMFAQVPLNGFCKFQEFNIKPGFEKIFAADYSGDGYRDLIIYNQSEKKYLAETYDSKTKLFKQSEKYSSLELTNINSFGKIGKRSSQYIFTSRKRRTAGLFTFSKTGSVIFSSNSKFNSYPSSIDVADIDRNGNSELLISGITFSGLSILQNNNRGWEENSINRNKSFAYSTFIDLDYDLYDDVAAVDLFTNSIRFFYNEGNGFFSEQRSIKLDAEISEFRSSDINLDGFTDFSFIKNRNLEILFGDSVSTFQKKITLDKNIPIDKYAVFDFNGDGYNDVACLNIKEGTLSIFFAANAYTFHQPFVYFKREGIVDLTAYVDRGGRKLSILDKTGKLYLISKANDFDDTGLAAGFTPSLIGTFNFMNDRSPDFYFIDEEKQQLKIFLSAGNNLFDKYFSYGLTKNYSNVIVDEQFPTDKTFYCYSRGQRAIEIVNADLENGTFSRRILYANGPIVDMKLEQNVTRAGQTIYLLLNSGGTLYLQSFKFRDFRFLRSTPESISTNVESAAFSFGIDKEIFFITKFGNTLYLNKTTLNPENRKIVNVSTHPLTNGKNISYEINCFEDRDLNVRPAISTINEDGNVSLNIFNRGNYHTISLENFNASLGCTQYQNAKEGRNLFLYDKNSGKMKKINLRKNFYTYSINDSFESKTINSYIAALLNSSNEYLVYTDIADNLIKFKVIK